MENQISIDDFVKKYPKTTVERNILIIKIKYEDYDESTIVAFEPLDLKGNNSNLDAIMSRNISLYEKNFANQWLWVYREDTAYSEESLSGFYFPTNFSSVPIPQKYSQMIGYSDCLIDTTVNKIKTDSDEDEFFFPKLPENWDSLSTKEKEALLDIMRSIEVIGSCSHDDSPRRHAIRIAWLAAETHSWEVFLRAHLDIMNDHFERTIDASYAWGKRGTYIKELEELNINVADLIFGISFRIENPASNHYYGKIERLGRALSETKNRTEIENTMLAIISDTELDYYNRLLFYFLFKNYNRHIKDNTIKKENSEKLAIAAATFPDYFSTQLTRE